MFVGAFLFAARAWTQLTAAILLILAARQLSPPEVGVFSLASALTMVLTQWVGVGSYEYIIRERADPLSVSTAFWSNMLVSTGLAALGLAVAALAPSLFRSAELGPVICALAPLTLPAACRSAMEALMIRDGRLHRLAISTTVVETLALCAGVIALWRGFGLWSLVVHKWTQMVSAALVFTVAAGWRPSLGFSASTAKAMARFGAGILGDRFLNYFQTYGVDLVIGALLNPAAVAVYRVGARLVVAVTTVATEPLRQLSWKHLTDAAHRGQSIPRAAEQLIAAVITLFAGPLIGLAVTSDLVVDVVLGHKWAASVAVVRLVALTPLVGAPALLTEASLGALGLTRWLPALRAVSLSTMFGLLIVLVKFGPAGAAASQLAAASLMLIMATLVQRRLAGVRVLGYLRTAAACAFLSGIMVIAILTARTLAASAHASSLTTLAACLLAGGAVYLPGAGYIWRSHLLESLQRFRTHRVVAAVAER